MSPALRQRSSVPDLFALVDDLEPARRRLGLGPLRRWLARPMPPLVLPYRGAGLAAKLNVATPPQIRDALRRLPDLYLAGRLSKRVLLLWARDPACAAEAEALLAQARGAVVALALAAQGPGPASAVVRRALALSYEGELRPERPGRLLRLYQSDAAAYDALYLPLISALAPALGLRLDEGHLSADGGGAAPRAAARRRVARLLRRSRWRFALRMVRQALVYRGWALYLLGKLRRAARPPRG